MDVAVEKSAALSPTLSPVRPRIGEILVSSGVLKESDVEKILAVQRKRGLHFGEAAVALRILSERDLRRALAAQFDYPFVAPGESALAPALVAAYEPFSQYTEQLRTLRSQLLMKWFGSHGTALAVTAPRSGDGCSTLAANLAIVFAQLGERTLLIDTNMRNPVQYELFGLEANDGLAEVLNGRISVDESLHRIAHFENLYVLPAGAPPPNPQELLSRLSFTELLEELSARFDVMLLDTPPLLNYADAQIVSARTGACLLGTRRHSTTFADVERAKTQLSPNITTILGAVISG
jgi:protein-tyrosine kinase